METERMIIAKAIKRLKNAIKCAQAIHYANGKASSYTEIDYVLTEIRLAQGGLNYVSEKEHEREMEAAREDWKRLESLKANGFRPMGANKKASR